MVGEPRMSAFSAIAITVLFGLAVIGVYALVHAWRRKWRLRQKEKKLEKLLAGRSLDAVLAEAYYEFAHFQGEDGYRLYDKREKEGFLGFVYTPLDAHLWIVERHMADRKD